MSKVRMKIPANKYKSSRKKMLKELRNLIYQRSKINTAIRGVNREMSALDNALLNEDE